MMTRMMTRFFAVLYAVALAYGLTATPNTYALPIQGSLGFAGAWQPLTLGVPSATIAGTDSANILLSDNAFVVATMGADFSGLLASLASYNDFAFNPFSPVANLLSVGGFTFDLNSLAIEAQDAGFLDLSGMGVIRAAGFDDTPARWSFSADTSFGNLFAFSSTITSTAETTLRTTPTPEPTTLLLLGIGLAALCVVTHRRTQ